MTDTTDIKALRPAERAKLGFVTDDNTGGHYVAECEECGQIFPSQTCDGGEQIADSGDYGDCYCPHCGFIDPLECDNANLVWNVQQLKIVNLTKQIEAERQRAAGSEEELHKALHREKSVERKLLAAQAEIAELKGEQVPVAWNVGGLLTFDKQFAECRSNEDNLLLEPLYRHPIITGIDENHYDPELEPGLYVAEIITKGGAACINGRFTEQLTALDAIPAEYQIREINASGTKWSPWRKVSADYYEKMKPRYEVMNPGVECIQYRELFTAPKKS